MKPIDIDTITLEPRGFDARFPYAEVKLSFECRDYKLLRDIHGIIDDACHNTRESYAKNKGRMTEVLRKGMTPKVDRVMFNNQATILFWNDGEKTVVKCRECGDGHCIYDKDFNLFLGSDNTVIIADISQLDNAVENIARCAYCQQHFDSEKAVMAAMLKRLYPNFQDVMRGALEGGDD